MINVLSLFSGCGGLDLGFEQVGGYHTVWANDFKAEACESFRRHFGDIIVEGDVEAIDPYTDNTIPDCDLILGGFPCQDFSHAAHGKNIAEKNLWDEMLRFVQESDAPIVFGENVTEKAILKAKHDLENIGYAVKCCCLGCGDLNADHRRNRFWLLAIKDFDVFNKIVSNIEQLPKFTSDFWAMNPNAINLPKTKNERKQAKAVGNAQSPIVAAVAFRILGELPPPKGGGFLLRRHGLLGA